MDLKIKYIYIYLYMCCLCLQPKLSMAKCRRNVENFLDACRRIGVPEVRPRCNSPVRATDGRTHLSELGGAFTVLM